MVATSNESIVLWALMLGAFAVWGIMNMSVKRTMNHVEKCLREDNAGKLYPLARNCTLAAFSSLSVALFWLMTFAASFNAFYVAALGLFQLVGPTSLAFSAGLICVMCGLLIAQQMMAARMRSIML